MTEKPKVLDLMSAIRAAYPDATAADIKASLTPDFLAAAYGKMPGYSTLQAPALHNVKTATVGSAVVCYGLDTSAGATRSEPLIAIIKRNDRGPNGEDRFGILGGYTNLGSGKTAGEQPKNGAVRELKEEAINDKGEPVIDPDPDRLKLIVNGIDYRVPALPTVYHAHALELSVMELAALKEHSRKLNEDPAYKAAAIAASGGEVADLKIMPVSDVLKMPRESFTHPHELDAVQVLAEQLRQQSMAKRV